MSDSWTNSKKSEKYSRMKSFTRKLPEFTRSIAQLKTPVNLSKPQVLAIMFELLLNNGIRIGNEIYAREK